MWSFAVLLWELVTREVPFADLSNMEIGMKVSKGRQEKRVFFPPSHLKSAARRSSASSYLISD